MINPSAGRHSRILGLGTYRPRRVVPNAEIAPRLGLTDAWIEKRSGVQNRRFGAPDEPLPVMAAAAAGKAFAQAGIEPAQVGCVILATVTHLNQLPSLASEAAYRMGAVHAGSYDVAAACAGFPYALATASSLVSTGNIDYAVVIGAERFSDIIDHDDPATAFIFADGAGAVVVGPSTEPGIGPVVWGTDGSRADAVRMTGYWLPELQQDPSLKWPVLGMSGWKVYRWAVENLAAAAREAVARAGLTMSDLDAFIPHQANMLITNELVRQLEMPPSVAVANDVVHSGNTSAASIPLAMETLLASGDVDSGGLGLLIGFGSGMVYASQVVRLP
jgi:3-oxoacyl-(acyl-carrier-protein) synthase III